MARHRPPRDAPGGPGTGFCSKTPADAPIRCRSPSSRCARLLRTLAADNVQFLLCSPRANC
ncbi:Hypothetical protein I596_3423 [Dokdonella koreensis DS-123]|uniref:Uncharacterized protein n=1 Tax=Dokdonella koreensis DS-123 TaxID=1300342 RepID=A0A167H869_9GAMM|nr:Hypothetical protein I596_3423 [Dokdonella koreensis DS-123]